METVTLSNLLIAGFISSKVINLFVDCEFACIKLTDCVMNDKVLQEIGKAGANNDRNICKY